MTDSGANVTLGITAQRIGEDAIAEERESLAALRVEWANQVLAARDVVMVNNQVTAALVELGGDIDVLKAHQAAGIITNEDFTASLAAIRAEAEQLRPVIKGLAGADIQTFNDIMVQTAPKVEEVAAKSTAGLSRMGFAMGMLASQATGTNSALGRLAAGGLMFGAGTPMMLGILGGLAALAFEFDLLTKSSRDQEKALDAQIKKLDEMAAATLPKHLQLILEEGAAQDKLVETSKDLANAQTQLADAQAHNKTIMEGGTLGHTEAANQLIDTSPIEEKINHLKQQQVQLNRDLHVGELQGSEDAKKAIDQATKTNDLAEARIRLLRDESLTDAQINALIEARKALQKDDGTHATAEQQAEADRQARRAVGLANEIEGLKAVRGAHTDLERVLVTEDVQSHNIALSGKELESAVNAELLARRQASAALADQVRDAAALLVIDQHIVAAATQQASMLRELAALRQSRPAAAGPDHTVPQLHGPAAHAARGGQQLPQAQPIPPEAQQQTSKFFNDFKAAALHAQEQLKQMREQAKGLGGDFYDLTAGAIQGFTQGLGAAFAALTEGSKNAGKALEEGFAKAIGQVAKNKGDLFAAEIPADIAEGLLGNPSGFAAAAEHGLAAAAMYAVAARLGGGGGSAAGGGGSGGGQPASLSYSGTQRGQGGVPGFPAGPSGTVVIQFPAGKTFNYNDPAQVEDFREMLRDLQQRGYLIGDFQVAP